MATTERIQSLSPATPQTLFPRDKGFIDGVVTGFKAGLKETTGSYANDITARDEAKRKFNSIGEGEIPEAVYNQPNFAFRDDDIEWEPYLTLEMLARAKEAKQYGQAFADQPGFGKYISFFAGAMVDPINLIPLPGAGLVKGANAITRVAKSAAAIGAGNAVLEASISPLLIESYKLRGQEADFSDIARNVLFAGLAGGILGGGVKGLGEIVDVAVATRTPAPIDIKQPENYFNLRNIEDRAIINSSIINKSVRTSDDFLSGLDLIRQRTARYVDQYGFVSTTPSPLKHFKIFRDETGGITITGDLATIIKGRNRIANKIGDNEKITLVRDDGQAVFKNKQEFVENMNSLKDKTQITGNKDDFDTQIYTNPGVTKDNDFKDIYIRSNAETGELDVVRIQKNSKGKITKREVVTGQEKQLVMKKLHDMIAKDRNIQRQVSEQSGESSFSVATKTQQLQRKQKTEAQQKRVANMTDNDGDIETRLQTLSNRIQIQALVNRGRIPQTQKDQIFYSVALRGIDSDKLSRLGYAYDLQTQTLTKKNTATNLSISEELQLENIQTIERKLDTKIRETEGRVKSQLCATKKGL